MPAVPGGQLTSNFPAAATIIRERQELSAARLASGLGSAGARRIAKGDRMVLKSLSRLAWSLVLLAAPISSVFAADPRGEKQAAEPDPAAQTLRFSVRIVDDKGAPIAEAKVVPWAARSSLGHGLWPAEESKLEVKPKEVVTDAQGLAVVDYPVYYDPVERVRATAISLRVDHPKFASIPYLEVEVPRDADEPHKIELTPGVPVSFLPLIPGEGEVDVDKIHVVCSDERCWTPGFAPRRKKGKNASLTVPAMAPGRNSVLLVRMEGDRATHFSRIVDFDVQPGGVLSMEVALERALRISGTVSDNVPRPVRRGRISFASLNPNEDEPHRVWWLGWTSIAPDGSFVIDSWPAGEPLQMIGLCDGFMAAPGTAPKAVKRPPDEEEDLEFSQEGAPQVFEPEAERSLSLPMVPMGRCAVVARDQNGKPVPGLVVTSWPNVFWWNGGSQLYCEPLISMQQGLKHRDVGKSVSKDFPQPFQVKTGADGKGTLELPVGNQSLYVTSDTHELPIRANELELEAGQDRSIEVEIEAGKVAESVLQVQPRGTQRLGGGN